MAGLRRERPWARAALGLRAGLAALLAVGAAVLAVDVADWRYVRFDLTRRGSNTLDPAVRDVLAQLPEPVVIDAFLRPLARPYDGIFEAAQAGVLEFLTILHHARRDKVEIRVHDPRDFERTQARLSELGSEGTNKLILSCGERRAELALFGELVTVNWGNPTEELVNYLSGQGIPGVVDPRSWKPGIFQPASLQEFRGEELLTQALLKVSSGEAPRAYFAKGHGEPALDGSGATELARLRAILERDGFAVEEWDPLSAPEVPADCDVLALIGASQPYQAATRAAVQAYAEAGGRVLAAPDVEELQQGREGGIVAVLAAFDLAMRPGLICQPLVGFGGEKVEGHEQCAWLVIDERGLQPGHPLTEPLRMHGRRVQFTLSPAFESGGFQTDSGVVLPLVTTALDAWRDLQPYDFTFNAAKGEKRERYTLVASKQLRTSRAADGSVRQGRVLGVASAYFFDNESIDTNRDFALNAFNWLAEREYRIAVAPLERSLSYLDLQRGSARPVLSYALWLGLPGLCAAVGLLVFLRRRR